MGDKNVIHGEFCWNELMTGDTGKAKEFYGALLGWEFNDMDMGDMVYSCMKQGDKDIGGMMAIPKGQERNIPPHWMSYINVENLDDIAAKVEGLGGKIMCPKQTVKDYGCFIVVADPTGAHIAFWQSTKQCD